MEYMKNYDNFNNDKLSILGIDIYGLESSMKEFNEENLNEIINRLDYILNHKDIEKKHLEDLIEEMEEYLDIDIGFHFQENAVHFEKTLTAFHRENDILLSDLKKYVKDFLEKEEKTKLCKYMDKKLNINSKSLSKNKSFDKNLTILLKQIAINYKGNCVKYKNYLD
jgi:hypothetical protein